MKSLVTGGSGFIGSHLVDRLVDLGHIVYVIDKQEPLNKEAIWLNIDLNLTNDLEELLTDIENVFHLAAVADATIVNQDAVNAVKTNYLGTAHLLEACRRNNIKRFIFASTVWVYSDMQNDFITEEDTIVPPKNLYASLKYTNELLIQNLCALYSIPYTILRYGIPYGNRMRDKLAIPSMVRSAIENSIINVYGDGSQTRKFVHVNDLIDGHIACLNKNGENQIFNLEGTDSISIKELSELVLDTLKINGDIIFTEARGADYKGRSISNKKAKDCLNWQPKIPLVQGLTETISNYNKSLYAEMKVL
ncbi:NAD-dependent epimerase/dehydratase family protein [Bacillus wiedmannii]|uniref:NAD-dependent epimerase/dehydratase family protein n=1 Tax=Bacillus wiedmannii TaxID=1890302 RepID=UPI000BF0FD63|nr:NAD-dependent epimerase/dehydratase family protein [Bacillus wiedmannii]PEM24430.1 epimerase [Bacillus wiedmannii]